MYVVISKQEPRLRLRNKISCSTPMFCLFPEPDIWWIKVVSAYIYYIEFNLKVMPGYSCR